MPACVIVKVWPPIASVPVLGLVARLAATLKVIEPLPSPLAAELIISQLESFVALQLHPVVAPILIDPVPPVAE